MKRKSVAGMSTLNPKRRRTRQRTGDLLPSADPYILALVRRFGSAATSSATLDPSSPSREVPEDLYFGEDWGFDPVDTL